MKVFSSGYPYTDTIVEIFLTQRSIEMEKITVEATRPIIIHDISNSQINITSDEITDLPFDDISDVLGLQAGIEGLSVRGGGVKGIFISSRWLII